MTIINALPFNLQNGTTADATQVMANFNEILNDTNTNAAHNGVNTDITALTGLTTPVTPAQGGTTIYYGAGGGTANAQTIASPIPANFVLTAGYSIFWVPSVSNTAAFTLNVNATGNVSAKVQTESGLQNTIGGEVVISQLAKATYDGNFWVLDLDVMSGFGTVTNLASATTTDLGTALSHSINITGTTTITAFGSTALLARPLYKLVFSGALLLTYNATSLLLPGSGNITTANGDAADALYLGSGNWQILAYYKRTGQPVAFPAAILQNYISGLTLSTAGSSGTFGIAAGVGTDSTNALVMTLASAYTKTTGSWAVGSGNGALDTGAIANTTWYHVFLIARVDTGVTDILFSLSATSPTLPTNYTLFRRIGSMKTDGSVHWLAFTQTGSRFMWNTLPTADVANVTASAAAQTPTLAAAPLGVINEAILVISAQATTGNSFFVGPRTISTTPGPSTNVQTNLQTGNNQIMGTQFNVLTDVTAKIFWIATLNGNSSITILVVGWIDFRGTT